MGFLQVGIIEDLVLSAKTGFDEKGYFTLGFTTQVDTNNMFAAFDEGGAMEADEATPKFFSPSITDFNGNPKTYAAIGDELNKFKATLVDVLKTQMPEEKAKLAISAQHMFNGLGITAANQGTLAQKLIQQEFVDAVYKNICNAFLNIIAPFIGKNPFRVKFVRQSEAKHFPKVPKQGKFPNPWIESMGVAKEQSALKYSAYEIKNGLNDGTPVAQDTPAAADSQIAENLFEVPAASDIPTPEEIQNPTANVQTPVESSNPFNQ